MRRTLMILAVVVIAAVAAALIATHSSQSAARSVPADSPASQASFAVVDANGQPVKCAGRVLHVSRDQLVAGPAAGSGPAAPTAAAAADSAAGVTRTAEVGPNGQRAEHVTARPMRWGCGAGGHATLMQPVGP